MRVYSLVHIYGSITLVNLNLRLASDSLHLAYRIFHSHFCLNLLCEVRLCHLWHCWISRNNLLNQCSHEVYWRSVDKILGLKFNSFLAHTVFWGLIANICKEFSSCSHICKSYVVSVYHSEILYTFISFIHL